MAADCDHECSWLQNISCYVVDTADWRDEHLWLYALALGFSRDVSFLSSPIADCKVSHPRVTHNIALFLFSKMGWPGPEGIGIAGQASYTVEDFKNPQFRKLCSLWLRHIANEEEGRLPCITPSAFLFPAGPKLTRALYQLAKHVVIKDMKKNSIGTDIPFAEAVNIRPKDMYMAEARYRVASNKLLQIFQKEDFVIQEYMRKARLLTEEINKIKNECVALQMQSSKMEQNDQNKTDNAGRVHKVRSMWTLIMEMLTSLKNEKEIVDSVLKAMNNPDILDGNNAVFTVPELLARRLESDTGQCFSGNIYEAEKSNYVVVIQLLNESLRALRDEHLQSEFKQLLQVIKKSVLLHNTLVNAGKAKRLKVEYSESVNASISRRQEDWEAKWKSFLGTCPLNLILDNNPDLDLTVLPHSSSDLEEEEENVFDQSPVSYLASVADIYDSAHEVCHEKDDEPLETVVDKSTGFPERVSSVPLELSEASENRDVLTEKILKNEKDEFNLSDVLEDASLSVTQVESPVKKDDLLQYAREKLAEEVAKAVMSDSPQTGEGKGMAIEDLVNTLAFNPFLTRKQIPRTPENLLTEIRSSWRKAIQTDGLSDTEQAPTDVVVEEAPMDAKSTMQKAADPTFLSPAPDFDRSLSGRKSQLSSTGFRLQEEMTMGHTGESLVSKSSGVRESKQTEEQEMKLSVLNESFVEELEEMPPQYVKKSMNTADTCSENSSRACSLPSGDSCDSFMGGVLHRKMHLLPSLKCETSIQDESFPEELESINLNKSASSVFDHNVIDSTDGLKNKNIQKLEQDLESLFKTHEVLKKTGSTNEEVLYQTYSGSESLSCISETSLAPEERYDSFRPMELFMDDEEEWAKMSLPVSCSEKKYSLSSLLVSCKHLEEMASVVNELPIDIMQKIKDIEQLNEELGMKKTSSE